MAINTKKFSEFDDAGDIENDNITVGYSGSNNQRYNNPWVFLKSGASGDRPAPDASMYYRLRFNTTTELYEYYNPTTAAWEQAGLAIREIEGTTDQLGVTNADGVAGNPVIFIENNPRLPGNVGFQIPAGTTAQRVTPVSPAINMRYNTDLQFIEYYDHATSSWTQIPGTSSGTFLPLTGGTMSGDIDMGTNSIINLPVPSASTEAATKGYVDGISFNVHAACNYGTTGNLAGYTYSNGTAGVGATLTAGSNGAFSIDGSSPALNDRILVKDQTAQAENGIYALTQVGDASNPAILTRANDYDEAGDMDAGDEVAIIDGSTLVGSKWMMTQTATITVGTTAITWIDISVPENLVTIDGTQTITGAKTFNDLTLGADMDADSHQINNVTDPTAAQDAATKNYVDNAVGGVTANASTVDINQVGHGFVVGDVVKLTGANTYAKAQADSVANAEVAGIVSAVADTDNFTLTIAGQVTGLSSLTAAEVYFLDPSTAGAITTTEPTTAGQISKPVFITDSTTSGFFYNFRGNEVGTSTIGGFQSQQIFTSSRTWTKPADITKVRVTVVAGGGGSGGVPTTSGTQFAASGGGTAGGVAIKLIDVTSTSSETVTIGAGGTGGAAGSNPGTNGGTTSFGAFCSATGGDGGSAGVASGSITSVGGGSGGSATGGDLNIRGGDSPLALIAYPNTIIASNGGNNIFSTAVRGNSSGEPGRSYGGGAGGLASSTSAGAKAGKAGADGIVIVEEYS